MCISSCPSLISLFSFTMFIRSTISTLLVVYMAAAFGLKLLRRLTQLIIFGPIQPMMFVTIPALSLASTLPLIVVVLVSIPVHNTFVQYNCIVASCLFVPAVDERGQVPMLRSLLLNTGSSTFLNICFFKILFCKSENV